MRKINKVFLVHLLTFYQSFHTHFDRDRVLSASVSVLFSLSARRWWYEVVVIVVAIATSCSSPLPPVTADLLGWSSAIWRYTKSHYSVGHGLDEEERNTGWGMIKEGPHSPHTNRLTGRQRDGGGGAKDLILGEKEIKFRMFVIGHSDLFDLCVWIGICLLLVYVYVRAAAQTH